MYFFSDFGFLVEIIPKIMSQCLWNVHVGRALPEEEVITFWEDLDHILDTKKSRIFENAPGRGLCSMSAF